MNRIEEFLIKLGAWFDRNIVGVRLSCLSLLLLFFGYCIAAFYNKDMGELNYITETRAQIGKEFQRRADLVPSLSNIADNYAGHELLLFRHVSDMRARLRILELPGSAPTPEQSARLERELLGLMAMAEQYPELKAEKCYRDLMDAEELTEDRIAETMHDYIGAVGAFNISNQSFWHNYFTYLPSLFIPLPAWWEYYHTATRGDVVERLKVNSVP